MAEDVEALAERMGHRFADIALLARATAHRSWCAEHPGTTSNERLEFLGDAVLGWIVADLAFRRFRDLPEGALTGVRKGVVNATALAEVARTLDLGEFLLLGRGEDAAGGRDKPSILSDAFEAVIGALYVDGGPDVAYAFVERTVSTSGSSGTPVPVPVPDQSGGRASERRSSSSAARWAATCSAVFFERPVPSPSTSSPTTAWATKRLSWSGPLDRLE